MPALITRAALGALACSLPCCPAAEIQVLPIGTSEAILAELDPARWHAQVVWKDDLAALRAHPEYVLVNGGYFDEDRSPSALLIAAGRESGHWRADKPYSGFVAMTGNALELRMTTTRPEGASDWLIQSGPLLVEPGGVAGINRSTDASERTVIGRRGTAIILLRTGAVGLRAACDLLIGQRVDAALNLDGGPSSVFESRIGGQALRRGAGEKVPYFLGFWR